MKKLLIPLLLIVLGFIAYFQYDNWRRFNPPAAYSYEVSTDIDPNYHDQTLVTEYYANAVEIGSFARNQWFSQGIDVRFADTGDLEARQAVAYYNQLLARTQQIEQILTNSKVQKDQGFTNEQVQLLESGFPQELLPFSEELDDFYGITLGSIDRHVWILQKRLIEKGFSHPIDGVFGTETQTSLTQFQTQNDLFPSGLVDRETLIHLFR